MNVEVLAAAYVAGATASALHITGYALQRRWTLASAAAAFLCVFVWPLALPVSLVGIALELENGGE